MKKTAKKVSLVACSLALLLAASMLAACHSSSISTESTQDPQSTPSQSSGSQSVQTPTSTPAPTATPIPTATPTPTSTPTPDSSASSSTVMADWQTGYYEKNAGSAAGISLQITSVTKDGLAFSIDAKGVTVSGTAALQADGTAQYVGSDCTLFFTCTDGAVILEEENNQNPNVSFAGTYQLSR